MSGDELHQNDTPREEKEGDVHEPSSMWKDKGDKDTPQDTPRKKASAVTAVSGVEGDIDNIDISSSSDSNAGGKDDNVYKNLAKRHRKKEGFQIERTLEIDLSAFAKTATNGAVLHEARKSNMVLLQSSFTLPQKVKNFIRVEVMDLVDFIHEVWNRIDTGEMARRARECRNIIKYVFLLLCAVVARYMH